MQRLNINNHDKLQVRRNVLHFHAARKLLRLSSGAQHWQGRRGCRGTGCHCAWCVSAGTFVGGRTSEQDSGGKVFN